MKYMTIGYHVKFKNPVRWSAPPEFVWRSVLGLHLKRLCCLQKDEKNCSSCPLNATCVYAWFFESPVPKDTVELVGRDHAPHPFVMEYDARDPVHGTVTLTFMGRGMNYIPYVTLAFRHAGEKGVSRERVSFELTDVTFKGKTYEPDIRSLEKLSSTWPGSISSSFLGPVEIDFVTPCRIKKEGSFIDVVSLDDLLKSISRRMKILESLYGNEAAVPEVLSAPASVLVDQRWKELTYYSSRQKIPMRLGGVVGGLRIETGKTPWEDGLAILLEAGMIFHVGKNVSFGLGRIRTRKEPCYVQD